MTESNTPPQTIIKSAWADFVYPAKMSINLLHSLLAPRTFTELGKLDQLLTWKKAKSLAVV